MDNYNLKKLALKLSEHISEMEMKGFDSNYDDFWEGTKEFQIEFEDCVAIVNCDITKTYCDEEIDSRKVSVNTAYLQFEEDKKPISFESIKFIEEQLKI